MILQVQKGRLNSSLPQEKKNLLVKISTVEGNTLEDTFYFPLRSRLQPLISRIWHSNSLATHQKSRICTNEHARGFATLPFSLAHYSIL